MLPFYIFAQKGAKHMPNNDNSNTLVDILTEERTKVKTLSDSIKKLNQQISETETKCQNDLRKHEREISEKNEYIDKLNTDKENMSSEITKLKDGRDSLRNCLNLLGEIIYTRCLLYPLDLPYDSTYIEEYKNSIQKMDIEKLHPTEYKTYYHFLDEYKDFNKEVKGFLERQKDELKLQKGHLDMMKIKAGKKIKALSYYKYYEKRNHPPLERIGYLDRVIDKFFSLLNSNELNKKNLQELINKLPETETETKTATTTDAVTDVLDKYIDDLISLLHSGKLNKEDLQDLIDKLPKTETATNTTAEAEAEAEAEATATTEPKTNQDK